MMQELQSSKPDQPPKHLNLPPLSILYVCVRGEHVMCIITCLC